MLRKYTYLGSSAIRCQRPRTQLPFTANQLQPLGSNFTENVQEIIARPSRGFTRSRVMSRVEHRWARNTVSHSAEQSDHLQRAHTTWTSQCYHPRQLAEGPGPKRSVDEDSPGLFGAAFVCLVFLVGYKNSGRLLPFLSTCTGAILHLREGFCYFLRGLDLGARWRWCPRRDETGRGEEGNTTANNGHRQVSYLRSIGGLV